MRDMNFFQLVLYYLEERQSNNVYTNLQKDAEFLNAVEQEQELCRQYENLNLTDEQRKIINRWIDSIHAQNCAYTAVIFRMAMQYGFSILVQLADLT